MQKSTILVTLSLALFWTVGAPANPVSTDPDEAPIDFQIQGEYSGNLEQEGGRGKFGGQIIALGDGKFQGVGYPGGLPGDGWGRQERMLSKGTLEDDVVRFTVPDGGRVAELKDGSIAVFNAEDERIGRLEKLNRNSPTLGAKPPAGAAVLFDGTSPDAFERGRMTEDGLLMQGATSKQTFGSHTIHLEFRTPFQPTARGQGRGNSGFYAQGRYEVQILDSFGLRGEQNECGGIYSIAAPKLNMCFPPLSWQTYDIDFTAAQYENGKKVGNARMTVRHNGVVIHDDVELTHATTAAPVKEGPEPGPVYLQDHGNPVRFRNIWVVPRD